MDTVPSKAPIYCVEQIQIPPDLPEILKQYTKAVIRTRPRDLLLWSYTYFHALARGEKPPVAERLELVPTGDGLTLGRIKTLHDQVVGQSTIRVEQLRDNWIALGLEIHLLGELLQVSGCPNKPEAEVDWLNFMAVACGSLAKTLTETMQKACELLTEDPPGGRARIPYPVFEKMYVFLASEDGDIPESQIQDVLRYLSEEAKKQDNLIHPLNFTNGICPPLGAFGKS